MDWRNDYLGEAEEKRRASKLLIHSRASETKTRASCVEDSSKLLCIQADHVNRLSVRTASQFDRREMRRRRSNGNNQTKRVRGVRRSTQSRFASGTFIPEILFVGMKP